MWRDTRLVQSLRGMSSSADKTAQGTATNIGQTQEQAQIWSITGPPKNRASGGACACHAAGKGGLHLAVYFSTRSDLCQGTERRGTLRTLFVVHTVFGAHWLGAH